MLPVVSSICAENVFSVLDDSTMRAMTADAQLQMAEEARVVVKKSNVGRARGMNVSGYIGSAESFAVDEREIIDLPRLHRWEGKTRLHVWRRNLNQLLVGKCEIRTHAQRIL